MKRSEYVILYSRMIKENQEQDFRGINFEIIGLFGLKGLLYIKTKAWSKFQHET